MCSRTTPQELQLRIDDLSHFGFSKLTPIFLGRMKEEIKEYQRLARDQSFDWDSLPGAAQWAAAQKDNGKPWQLDTSEKCRRVWEWWIIHRHNLTFFKVAVRLVVLIQVSSAAVERIFSQLKLILETTQQHTLHDAIELRLFERVNTKHYIED
jgi:hypothetical protein